MPSTETMPGASQRSSTSSSRPWRARLGHRLRHLERVASLPVFTGVGPAGFRGDALAAQRAGEIEPPSPTFVTLSRLAAHAFPRAALAAAADVRPTVYLPRIAKGTDAVAASYPGDAGWEARDASLAGPRHRLLFLTSGWRYLREGA